MLLDELAPLARDHYVEQLLAFVRHHKSSGKRGGAEVKFKLSDQSEAFRQIVCVDYVENDQDGVVPLSLTPERKLDIKPFRETRGATIIDVRGLCWDDVRIATTQPIPDLGAYFEKWFDPDERNFNAEGELSGNIHSLLIDQNGVEVDFGSAPADALFDLLDTFALHGITEIALTTSR